MSIMISNVPETWRLEKLGQIFEERKEKVSDKDFAPLSVTKQGIVPQMEHVAKSDDSDNRKRVAERDFVINSRSDRRGSSGLSNLNGSVSLINIVLTPRHGYPRFLHYLMRSYAFQEEFYRVGHGIVADLWTTRYSELKGITVALPSEQTQKEIANFLDSETTQIDQLIEKKKRLISLIIEREKSVITHALLRGMRDANNLKETGVEWIGKIPSHWSVFPLKQLIWYQEGPGILAKDFKDDGVPLLRIKGISSQTASLKGCNFLDPEKVQKTWKHFQVEKGDLLISASATRGGIASEVTEETVGAVPYTGIIRVKPRKFGYCKGIIPFFMLSSLFDTQIDLFSAGSTIQHFGPSHLGRMKAVLPPLDEQKEIIIHLNKATSEMRKLQSACKHGIDLLKEFRTSLITEAVTGQLDISSWKKRGNTDRRLDNIEESMRI